MNLIAKMVFTKFINPAHDHAWHAQSILLFESLLVPQSAQFLFQTGPKPHKLPALTRPGLQVHCFTHPSASRRMPFVDPRHFWCLYLKVVCIIRDFSIVSIIQDFNIVMPPSHVQFETCANYTLPSRGLEQSTWVHTLILVWSIEKKVPK
jgi:hypothetical protein